MSSQNSFNPVVQYKRPSVNNLNLQIPLPREIKPNGTPLLQLQKMTERRNYCVTS